MIKGLRKELENKLFEDKATGEQEKGHFEGRFNELSVDIDVFTI